MKIENYTPHDINILFGGNEITIPSSGIARCEVKSVLVDTLANFLEVYSNVYGEVSGLPEEEDGTIIIVSRIVAENLKGIRHDLYIVNDTARNEKGQIIGCRSLAKV